jgi:hypothetical protein
MLLDGEINFSAGDTPQQALRLESDGYDGLWAA